jgi:hypothetical protein
VRIEFAPLQWRAQEHTAVPPLAAYLCGNDELLACKIVRCIDSRAAAVAQQEPAACATLLADPVRIREGEKQA